MADSPPQVSLLTHAVTGVRWLSLSTTSTTVLNLFQIVVLSRLLEPEDFGLMAMIWVVLGFAQLFADLGMTNALIHRQDATHEQLSSVYWLSVGTALSLALLALLSTPLLVWFNKEPALYPLMPWVVLSFAVMGVGQPFQVIAQRDFHFRRVASAEIASGATGAAVAIVIALLGYGVYALVFGGLAAACLRATVLIRGSWHCWRPSLHFRRKDLHGFARFGFFQMGERITNYAWSNVDYLLVGRFLGAGPLGIYRLAYETTVRPLAVVNPIFNTVAYPLFARKQTDDAALRRGFLELIRVVSSLVFPLMAGLRAVAPLAVAVVFGAKWAAAGPIIRILAILGALRALSNLVGSLIIAKGRVEISFFWNLILAIVNTIAFTIAVRAGLRTLAWTAVGTMIAVYLASWKSFYHGTIALRPLDYVKAISWPTLLSVVMAGFVSRAYPFLDSRIEPQGQLLAVLVGIGALTYFGLYLLVGRRFLLGLWRMALSRKPEIVSN